MSNEERTMVRLGASAPNLRTRQDFLYIHILARTEVYLYIVQIKSGYKNPPTQTLLVGDFFTR